MQFGISESVNHWAKYHKDKVAILSNDVSITYQQFNSRINSVSRRIDEINPAAKRISLAIKSKVDLIVTIIAVIRTGRSAVLLNINLPNDALKINIEDTATELLIYDDSYLNVNKLFSNLSIISANISELINYKSTDITYDLTYSSQEDEWGILFSSGTTGIPKGIERDHNSMITEFLGWCLELGLSKGTAFYIGRPIYYTGGLVLALSTFLVGGNIIVNDYDNDNDFYSIWDDYINTLDKIEIEWAFFIPDQIKAFCTRVEKEHINVLRRSENILVMGAPISGNEKTLANQLLQSNIIESWGDTESLGTITETEDLLVRPDSIGRPFITDELYIIDDDYNELPPNTIGRIAGNEDAGFSKYSNRPSETERTKRNKLIGICV